MLVEEKEVAVSLRAWREYSGGVIMSLESTLLARTLSLLVLDRLLAVVLVAVRLVRLEKMERLRREEADASLGLRREFARLVVTLL